MLLAHIVENTCLCSFRALASTDGMARSLSGRMTEKRLSKYRCLDPCDRWMSRETGSHLANCPVVMIQYPRLAPNSTG